MRTQRSRVVAGVAGVVVVVAAIIAVVVRGGGGSTSTPGVSGLPSASVPPGPAAPVAGLKPDVNGLIDRSGPPPAAALAYVHGFVVNAKWSELQPQQNGPIAANNVIDQGIATARRLNAQGAHLGVKVRIFAGIDAPDWLKAMDGGPITVEDPQSHQSGTVPHFWTSDVATAYSQLMQELAQKYDSVPEIQDVTISRCMTVFAEPMMRQISDRATVSALLSAGYSADADIACQTQQIDEAGAAFKHTHLSLSFNPYQRINSDGSTSQDDTVTESLMKYCRQKLGEQCTLENNSIRAPIQKLGGAYQQMYQLMAQLGPPICFQTAQQRTIGDLTATIQWAESDGAIAVELPGGYERELSTSTAAPLDAALVARPQR